MAGSTAALICDTGALLDYLVESAPDHRLFRSAIDRARTRFVNSIAGEDPMMGQWGNFWQADLKNADPIFRQALTSHIITVKHAAPIMIRNRRGLIVEVTENDLLEHTGHLLSSWELSRRYGFTDYDGRRPDWGELSSDWSVMPPPLVELFRTGTALQLAWLNTLADRTRRFLDKMPPA